MDTSPTEIHTGFTHVNRKNRVTPAHFPIMSFHVCFLSFLCIFYIYFVFLTCLSSAVLHDIAVLYFICVRLARFKKLLLYI